MSRDYVEQVASAIVEQLKAGTAPWIKPWEPGERFMPYNPTSGNAYRGMNAVWLLSRSGANGYDDARWLTYRQASEAGAQVRKGEKGTVVQYWKWQGLEPVRDAAGNPVLDQEGQPVRELVRYERPRVWSAVVFNAAQMDGLPPAPNRPAMAAWERHQTAETILTRAGVSIRHEAGDRAFYRLGDDTITLPERGQFPTADGYYVAALHELSHASGHPSRLNRDMNHPFGSEGYAREELRAEIASMMLGEQLSIGHDPKQHVAYVGSWIKALENDPREIFRAASDAEKIVALLRSFAIEPAQRPELQRAAGAADGVAAGHSPAAIGASRHPGMPTSEDRTYLTVPYAEKDDAKQLGAKWDRQAKAWYVPAGVALEGFQPWLPAGGSAEIAGGADPSGVAMPSPIQAAAQHPTPVDSGGGSVATQAGVELQHGTQPKQAVHARPVLDTLLGALRPGDRGNGALWEPAPTLTAERLAAFEQQTLAAGDETTLQGAIKSGRTALDALLAFRDGAGAAVMTRIRDAATTEPGGLAGVVSEMRDGGRFADLRRQFDHALAADAGLASAYDKAAEALDRYGKDRGTVPDIIGRHRDGGSITARFAAMDAAIGEAAATTPSRTDGRSMLDDLSQPSPGPSQGTAEARSAVAPRSVSAEMAARPASASMSP